MGRGVLTTVGAGMRVVTIDGPAGAGKSTVSRRLADRLGWTFLDTGAMYRAVALAALRAGAALDSDDAVGPIAERVEIVMASGCVVLDGEDVTAAVRSAEVTQAVRDVADSRRVRTRLVGLQRAFAAGRPIVTEGRDQGTVVFPDAFCKVFLTASPEERARRRHGELVARGETVEFETVLADQLERDARDRARAIAPLRPAGDAVEVETTGLALEQVVDHLERLVRTRLETSASAAGGPRP